MRFVGLDTSFRHTGVVILDDSGALLERYHLKNTALYEPEGYWHWQTEAQGILKPGDVVTIEGLSYGSIGRLHVLAGSYAMWLLEAYQKAVRIYIVPPIRVKKWAVNDVRAKKPKIIAWAKKELRMSKKLKLSEHEADALALAQIGLAAYSIQSLDDISVDTGQPGVVVLPHRQQMLHNSKGDGVTQTLGKSYFEGRNHGR